MTLLEIAKEFNMRSPDLAAVLGVSRTAFYSLKTSVGPARKKAAIEHLVLLNEKMYQEELAEASRRLEARYKAIDELERLMEKEEQQQ